MPSWIKFKCRCGCVEYARVRVRRPDGRMYATEFHFCLGCTAVFLEPELFSVLTPDPLTDVPGPMAHETDRVAVKGRTRFAKAKGKRENGGQLARPDDISKIINDYF